MKKYLLPNEGTFFKANLHSHSTFSDGQYKPEELKKLYKDKGYSVLSLTDHNVIVPHNDLSDESFIFITGIEININNDRVWPYYVTYHLNFYSKDKNRDKFFEFENKYDYKVVNDLIKKANKENFLVQYNHPRWSYQTASDFVNLEGLWGFEVYNHGCEIDMMDGYGEYEYETYCRLNVDKLSSFPAVVATDDNHNYNKGEHNPRSDSFGGWSMIKAKSLSYENIIEAMENGYLYASTGPEIKVLYIENNIVHIETSPCCCIAMLTDSRNTFYQRSNNDDLTFLDIPLFETAKSFRIEVWNTKKEKAFTKSYKIDNFTKINS